ncbi:MAG: hypothetical protein ACQEXJ_11030 [Myxococcota bacterium]
MRTTRTAIGACLLVGAFALGACNDVPVAGLEKSFTLKVEESTGTGDPVKIDFLWVVDNSTSMSQEQVSLADNFGTFTEILTEQFELDPRLAVTTMDMQCDPAVTGTAAKGVFNTTPATSFTPAAWESVPKVCTTNSDCAGLDCSEFGKCDGPPGEWVCDGPDAVCITNPNGSINSSCVRRCESDEECQAVFGDSRYECQIIGGTSGCLLPPRTEECPASVGPILGSEDLDLFSCLATVGMNQESCFDYEQGMASALAAVDPNGPNAESLNCTAEQEEAGECKRFLRDDAYLVIVFVTDEDDCSSVTPNAIAFENQETCALLATQAEGGPLVPVSHYVNRFKSVKRDPARVIIASIAGDAVEDVDAAPSVDHVDPPETCDLLATCDELEEVEAACETWRSPPTPCEGLPTPPEECADLQALQQTCDLLDDAPAGCGLPDTRPSVCDTLADSRAACTEPVNARSLAFRCTCSGLVDDYPAASSQRACYVASKSNPFECFQTTKICSSPSGQADWGARYFDLAARFGQNGVSTNICSAEGIGPALDQIADQIIRVVSQVCLPRPVLDLDTLEVRKTLIDPDTGDPQIDPDTGEPATVLLTRVDEQPTEGTDEYRIGPGGEDCEQAITFGDPPGPGEEVIIEYKGDPGFGQ